MRKLDRLLTGILLPVSEGLSAQTTKASPSCGDPVLTAQYFLFGACALQCSGNDLPCYFTSSSPTHDKIPNLFVRMCDSMLTVKDGPGVYRGQFLTAEKTKPGAQKNFAPILFHHII